MAATVPAAAAQQMAPQAQPPLDTPAQAVGNQFVSQYYTVQHASPKHLHRFYSETSTLTWGDMRPEGFYSRSATGQKTIHELVMELGYEDTRTEIHTIDSQYSLGGGVVVQVTGVMQRPPGAKRPFVQTFFLAVQEKGYYVLNDIFRYLPPMPAGAENGSAAATAASPAAPAAAPPPPAAPPAAAAPPPAVVLAPTPMPVPVAAAQPAPLPLVAAPVLPGVPLLPAAAAMPQQLAMQQMAMQQAAALAAAGKPNGVAGLPLQPPVAVQFSGYGPGAAVPMPPPPPPAQQQQHGPAPPPAQRAQQPPPAGGPAEPLSYAERLRVGGGRATSVPGSPGKAPPPPPPAEPQPQPQQPPAALPAGAAPPAEGGATAGGAPVGGAAAAAEAVPVDEHPNASIFVRGIPTSVTMMQLVEMLSEYGRLRNNGVILKTQKGRDSFAFIDFEESAPAQRLLHEGLSIEGARLDVQPKRPLIFRPAGRDGPRGGGPRGPYDGGADGGRGVAFRSSRGPRGAFPGAAPAADVRNGPPRGMPMPMGGPVPMPGSAMPGPMPPQGGHMPGRGFGPEGGRGFGGGRGYGGGRGRGRSGPPPMQQQQAGQQQQQQQHAAAAVAGPASQQQTQQQQAPRHGPPPPQPSEQH
ncbi:G3BP isoform X1 [Micractinium conductrix]|uniref:G3BP isoform X1 n=1 Tax=Micractinium conductrix TaxID=554055 RepID=A0A2P6UZX5_9CHLO|nr:G3BP isoform X1 [Micractinium conductrix]|eukprot:PSC67396.1 G3BP isoform X1 [Micractinium conductrix]